MVYAAPTGNKIALQSSCARDGISQLRGVSGLLERIHGHEQARQAHEQGHEQVRAYNIPLELLLTGSRAVQQKMMTSISDTVVWS